MVYTVMDVLSNLREFPVVCVDTETTGLHWYTDRMFGVAIAGWDGERTHAAYYDIRQRPEVLNVLRRELPHCKRIVNHNIKFDIHFLLNERVVLPMDRVECTSVRAALINEHEPSFSLDSLAKKYVGRGKTEIYADLAKLFGGPATRAAQMRNLHRAPVELTSRYAIDDPVLAILLWLWQEKEIDRQDLHHVWKLERELLPVLVDIERRGVRVDIERSRAALDTMVERQKSTQSALDSKAGRVVNVASPKQMRELFLPEKDTSDRWQIGGVHLEITEGGSPSINGAALRALADKGDERATMVLTLRKSVKAQQFLRDHILGHAVGDRVFPNYNQTRGDNELGTGTGRFSVNDPALQQIPSRDVDVASVVRPCFIPEDGHDWLCMDYAQFEQRWFGHYAKNDQIIKILKDDPRADFYQVISDMTGIPRNPVRAGGVNCKQIVLAMIFGAGQGKLASTMGLEYTEEIGRNGKVYLKPGQAAIDLMDKMYAAVPGIKAFLDQATSIAKTRGYVKTVMGRHIRFPHGQFVHKAGGLVLQGSAADSMKQKMVEIHRILPGTGALMLLSVHDELNFSLPKANAKQLTDVVSSVYTRFDGNPILCRVPIVCDAELGINWYETSKK